MIITRDVINKNINYYDYGSNEYYSYKQLSVRIDFFKNLLLDFGCKKGETVLIGYGAGIDQTALLFAICELGMVIIINDYKIIDDDLGFIDPKSKMLMPINYFFGYDTDEDIKVKYFKKICDTYITSNEVEKYNNYSKNSLVLSNPDDVILKCTSSGTTGTPKKVEHTHRFLYNISKRNASFFSGKVASIWNLNHGSSVATYFLPNLMSKDVKEVISANPPVLKEPELCYSIFGDTNHMMIPYTRDLILNIALYKMPNLTYYTLSSIPYEIKSALQNSRCKDVISFFGCNETSGPIFINKVSYINFDTDVYHSFDNYYKIENLNPLTVKLSEYNININTNDNFEKLTQTSFKFKGRSDLLRINGRPISDKYNLLDLEFEYSLVYDILRNKIYLAIWRQNQIITDEMEIKNFVDDLNDILIKKSYGDHYISKFDILNKADFIAGVKLDQEFLRSYFREKVKEYAKF